MDRTTETPNGQTGQSDPGVTNRAEYMQKMQTMVDRIPDTERREEAQSALAEVGRDLGFEAAKSNEREDKGLERERDFEREP